MLAFVGIAFDRVDHEFDGADGDLIGVVALVFGGDEYHKQPGVSPLAPFKSRSL